MKQGEIWFVEFTGIGNEYQKARPAVIIESDRQLKVTSVITVVPFTKQQKKHSDDIFVVKSQTNNLLYDSLIKVHQIQTLDQSRFKRKVGVLENEILEQIKHYLKKHFGV